MEQTFGRFVRQRRSSLGITLRGLASKLNLSPVYLSNIETDRKPAPTQEYLEKLAIELKLTGTSGSTCWIWRRNRKTRRSPQTFRTTLWNGTSSEPPCGQPRR